MDNYVKAAKVILDQHRDALQAKRQNHGFSDIRDGAGNHYVDLVMEGGGMLGYALLGYTYALEEAGVRFWNIAGTSAGAITAGFLAAAGRKDEAKSLKVLKALSEFNTGTMLDGHAKVVETIRKHQEGNLGPMEWGRAVFDFNPFRLFKQAQDGIQWTDFIDDPWVDSVANLGLNKGDTFLAWAKKVLAEFGIETTSELEQLMSSNPEGLTGPGHFNPEEKTNFPKLAMIAADIVTQSKVCFPDHAKLYWSDPGEVSPANYIRASMAVPFFFEPFRVPGPAGGALPAGTEEEWVKVGYRGAIPKEAIFLDGGIVSNFPIGMFHSRGPNSPACPTFGAKLNYYRHDPVEVSGPMGLAAAMFFLAKNSLDQEFLRENADYQKLVAYINTRNHGWLNFDMPLEDREDLFVSGVEAGVTFLLGFDWDGYKSLRRSISEVATALPKGEKPDELMVAAGAAGGGVA